MEQKEFLEGLKILGKYVEDDETFAYCDEDQMCFAPNLKELDREDLKKLDKLGFFWCEDYDCWSCFI